MPETRRHLALRRTLLGISAPSGGLQTPQQPIKAQFVGGPGVVGEDG